MLRPEREEEKWGSQEEGKWGEDQYWQQQPGTRKGPAEREIRVPLEVAGVSA